MVYPHLSLLLGSYGCGDRAGSIRFCFHKISTGRNMAVLFPLRDNRGSGHPVCRGAHTFFEHQPQIRGLHQSEGKEKVGGPKNFWRRR